MSRRKTKLAQIRTRNMARLGGYRKAWRCHETWSPCPYCGGTTRYGFVRGLTWTLEYGKPLRVPRITLPRCDGCGEAFLAPIDQEAITKALMVAYSLPRPPKVNLDEALAAGRARRAEKERIQGRGA